eukprot:1168034-Rhodomonas_salina.1
MCKEGRQHFRTSWLVTALRKKHTGWQGRGGREDGNGKKGDTAGTFSLYLRYMSFKCGIEVLQGGHHLRVTRHK